MATKVDDDYGDYVTRCICGFTHDDGYMIQCDGCSVWQHVECMQVNPNNLPDKYLCEMCEPRPVDRRRARQSQFKKREAMSAIKKKKKQQRSGKAMDVVRPEVVGKRTKREKGAEGPPKKTRRKSQQLPRVQHVGQLTGRAGSIQSLLNAASLLEERPWTDVWNSNTSPWKDKYELAEHNRYTEMVCAFIAGRLSQLKSEVVVYSQEEYCTVESRMPQPQCSLREVQLKRKGVVADVGIGGDELVVEYKGKVTVRQAVLSDIAGGKSLWKHKPCPFVYLYDKISDLDLCIDARYYGNLARFIRRSCSPNAELRHLFVSDELRFGVYATDVIASGEEVTLPFDFHYEKCDYLVECACGQKSMCLVNRCNRTVASKKRQGSVGGGGGGAKTAEEGETRQSRGSSHQRSQVLVHDDDSNSSWLSTGSGRRKGRHAAGPLSPRLTSRQTSHEVSSESDEEGTEKRSKSREERKTEAVWKMFEKMEASERRRQHLCSEGSVDSDTMSSPSTLLPPPLLSNKQQKERRSSSTSLRKVPILSGGKVRLSSVSSADPLSPTELSEAFSPPLTPRLSLHPPDGPFTAPSLPMSPLTSPPLSATTAHTPFEITPHLHPKYLFACFALPRKKAILKQWENEQQQRGGGIGAPLPFWPSNGHAHPVYSFRVSRGGGARTRAKGSLKHRWLKQHSEEVAKETVAEEREEEAGREAAATSTGSDKENQREESMKAPLPYKKQVLLRWEESNSEPGVPLDSDTHQPMIPPVAESTTKGSRDSSISSEAPPTPTSPDVPPISSSCTSPLFEEFSSDDEEFELPKKERKGGEGERGMKWGLTGEKSGHGGGEVEDEKESEMEGPHTPSEEPRTPPLAEDIMEEETDDEGSSNLSTISDTSLQSDTPVVDRDTAGPTSPVAGEPSTPPPPESPTLSTSPALTPSAPVNVSDISGSSEDIEARLEEEEHRVPAEPRKEEEMVGAREDSEVADVTKHKHAGISLGRQESEEIIDEVEMDVSSPADDKREQKGHGGPEGEGREDEDSVCETVDERPKEIAKETEQPENSQEAQPLEGERERLQEALRVHPALPREHQLVREQSSGSCSPDARTTSSPGSSFTPGGSRTPGKRKINLSEYRNRARKPADQRKSSTTSSPPHPTTPSSTSSFLSHVINPSLLSSTSSLRSSAFTHPHTLIHAHTSGGLLATGAIEASAPPGAPQFEPVSPDEGDSTPPMISMEDPGLGLQGAVPGVTTMLVPGLPGYVAGTIASQGGMLSSELVMAGQLPTTYVQQTPPATGQYILDARWSGGAPVDHGYDPRRGAIQGGGEMYVQQPLRVHTQEQIAALHAGLLPLPNTPTALPMAVQHPGATILVPLHAQPGPGDMQPHPQGMMHRPGEYHPPHPPGPGPRAPHGFVPHHQHRQVYRPRHPDSGGGYYGH